MDAFMIHADGMQFGSVKNTANESSYQRAISLAKALFKSLQGVGDDGAFTVTVSDHEGVICASMSSRRIKGHFVKQEWGGRKQDEAIFISDEVFDATDAVLQLSHKDLLELEDNSETTDELGLQHVEWSGPHEVSVTSSICEFFGVNALDKITPQHLEYVKANHQVDCPSFDDITVTLKIKVRRHGLKDDDAAVKAILQGFIKSAEFSVRSNTLGMVVIDTEVGEVHIGEKA